MWYVCNDRFTCLVDVSSPVCIRGRAVLLEKPSSALQYYYKSSCTVQGTHIGQLLVFYLLEACTSDLGARAKIVAVWWNYCEEDVVIRKNFDK